jgi:hypothetical protein
MFFLFYFLKVFSLILVFGLFFYSKIYQYKDRLDVRYRGYFNFLDKIFSPILIFLKKRIKPIQVGQGVAVDFSQFILLLILLLIINLL